MTAGLKTAIAPDAREAARRALTDLGRLCHARGWSDATSSNYSVRLSHDPLRVLITASGRDKGRLEDEDFVVVTGQGLPAEENGPRPSAELPLHLVIYENLVNVGAVIHTHSVWATILSDFTYTQNNLIIEGYEMQKGLAGVTTHQAKVQVKVFDNTQKIDELARRLRLVFSEQQPAMRYGFLLRRHGLYTWGADIDEARRHLEALEFLFEALGRRLMLGLTN